MCGIFGYIGFRNAIRLAIDGLKRVEYRGYDSAGLAYLKGGSLEIVRSVGKVSQLEEKLHDRTASMAIAHTRWATHGKVTEANAHPISDMNQTLCVVHNGVIENFQQLKNELEKQGVTFRSETDTEVVANLIATLYTGNLLEAVQEASLLLKGCWSLVVLHKDHPDQIVVSKQECPLVIGVGVNEMFVASDTHALALNTQQVVYLDDGEVALLTQKGFELFDSSKAPITKQVIILKHIAEESSKGDFEHYTLKEIFEQPQTVQNAMSSRFFEEYGTVAFDDLHLSSSDLLAIKRIVIIACGTSFHAGLIAGYMLEDIARIPTQVEISSEFRYKNPIVEAGTLVIAISQSGETADTLAAVRELKAKGALLIALCNVHGSTLTREADGTLYLHAGPEIGVCSTKAFTSQLIVLSLFCLMMARLRHWSKFDGQSFLHDLSQLPEHIASVLKQKEHIEALAHKYAKYNDCFFIGRRYMYPTCLEGALKLKEISYINANGYAAGEMKHGPIALLNEQCPTIALACDMLTYDKVLSNIQEAKARHSPIVAITFEGDERLTTLADDCIFVPKIRDELAPLSVSVACQLFAYYVAKYRGADIDKPRNLAKSVTVE
jgi:glucosamine--fructose-6-phosphate aminotransferase (isomerizing)